MTGDSTAGRPFVSVIVPVYNDPKGIRQCLTALTEQTYPDDRYEILVVDNGSTDGTRAVIGEFSVTQLVEDEIQGSYAARNRGLEHAEGEVFAFVDADCTPDSEWIDAGVRSLFDEDADLAAGRVRFRFSPDPTAAERFDALVHMRNDRKVHDGIAKTANLFARSSVVEMIGSFPQELRSGGDVYWTKSATDAGLSLVYAPQAVVDHPSRELRSLLPKMYRVGTGSAQMWAMDDETTVRSIVSGTILYPLKALRFILTEDDDGAQSGSVPPDRDVEMTVPVYLVGISAILMLAFGRIVGLVKSTL